MQVVVDLLASQQTILPTSRWIDIQHLSCIFYLLSSSSSSIAGTAWSGLRRLAALLSSHHCQMLPYRKPGYPSTPRHLLLFSGDGKLTPQRTSEPSYSSMCGHPLPRLPRLRVVPFLGLTVVHRPGALGVKERLPSDVDCTWRG